MDLHNFYELIGDKKFEKAHRWLDDELSHANDQDKIWIHYRRTAVYIGEKRYQDAIYHLKQHRMSCGTVTSVHNTLAMLYDITGQDDLALEELDTAPYDTDQRVDPLLTADAKFYRLYFRITRSMPVSQSEVDVFPSDYETYLPAHGRMRGVLVRKADLVEMLRKR